MTFEELDAELQKLVGERVSFVRIVCNSVIIYFHGEPGDSAVVSVFIDPTWRLQPAQADGAREARGEGTVAFARRSLA